MRLLLSSERQGVERILSDKDAEYDQLSRENLSTISAFGEAFMEVICRDACDGHDVGRVGPCHDDFHHHHLCHDYCQHRCHCLNHCLHSSAPSGRGACLGCWRLGFKSLPGHTSALKKT